MSPSLPAEPAGGRAAQRLRSAPSVFSSASWRFCRGLAQGTGGQAGGHVRKGRGRDSGRMVAPKTCLHLLVPGSQHVTCVGDWVLVMQLEVRSPGRLGASDLRRDEGKTHEGTVFGPRKTGGDCRDVARNWRRQEGPSPGAFEGRERPWQRLDFRLGLGAARGSISVGCTWCRLASPGRHPGQQALLGQP